MSALFTLELSRVECANCCNRTFTKLHQHMKTKHPTFGGAP